MNTPEYQEEVQTYMSDRLKSQRTRTTLLGLAVLLVTSYLIWLTSTLNQYDARGVTEMVSAQLQTAIPEQEEALAAWIEAEAPAVIDQGGQMLLDAPHHLRTERIEPALIAGAKELDLLLREQSREALAEFHHRVNAEIELRAAETGFDRRQALMEVVRTQYQKELDELIAIFVARYPTQLKDMRMTLEYLAHNETLEPYDANLREIIEVTLEIKKRGDSMLRAE